MAQKFRTALRPETFFPFPACDASLSDKRGIMIRGEGRGAKLTSQVRGRWDGHRLRLWGNRDDEGEGWVRKKWNGHGLTGIGNLGYG